MTRVREKDSPANLFWRVFVVAALGLFVLGSTLPNVHDLWKRAYSFGFSADPTLRVDAVAPGSPAQRAGVRVGDKIDRTGLFYYDLISVRAVREASPGQNVTVSFLRGNRRFTVHLVATPETPTFYTIVVTPLKRFVSLVFIIIGASLVLLRPNRMTWWFYLYALGSADATAFVYSPLSASAYNTINAIIYALYGGPSAALLGFACRFPTNEPTSWRRLVDRFVPYLYVVTAAVGAVLWLTIASAISLSSSGVSRVSVAFEFALYTLGAICLVTTFFEQRQQRQRTKWLIAGLILSALVAASNDFLFPMFPNPSFGLSYFHPDELVVLNIFVPITVAYAVLRHRVFDINFVISRALVYGILTSFIVIVFALIDWLFVRKLVVTNLGLIAEIIAAIAMGFWLNALHHRIDAFTDRVFFRQRHRAELRLSRVAAALPHATSLAALCDFIVSDPADALDLASAAVFIRADDRSYRRERSIGWPEGLATTLDANDSMVLHLQSRFEALRVSEIRWPLEHLPRDAAYPALAMPIAVRGQLVALAFYGAHNTGADLDPDEIHTISNLAVGAGVAYDHLKAQEMQSQLEAAQARIEFLEHAGLKSGNAPAS